MRKALVIVLSQEDQKELERLEAGRTVPVRVAERAGLVLRAARGMQNQEIAAEMHLALGTVGRWRRRFAEGGVKALLKDRPRGGRKPGAEMTQRIIDATTQTKPPGC